jgi:DNA processing protein
MPITLPQDLGAADITSSRVLPTVLIALLTAACWLWGGPSQTIAVCGNGLDSIYPSAHRDLAKQIAKVGLLISEYPPGTGPKGFHFPRRNRIIAALSLGTVVIEAAQKSGSLITAYLSSHLGREVFVIPGPISSALYAGSHRLIQEGAKLICGIEDVLNELPNGRFH